MLNKLLNDRIWTFGIIVVIIGIILSISLPVIFVSFELIMGVLIVLVGITIIHRIFK